MHQFSIADLLNQINEPIGPGDYVEHQSKPGVLLLVLKGPYLMKKTGNLCIDVQDPRDKRAVRVRLDYVRRV